MSDRGNEGWRDFDSNDTGNKNWWADSLRDMGQFEKPEVAKKRDLHGFRKIRRAAGRATLALLTLGGLGGGTAAAVSPTVRQHIATESGQLVRQLQKWLNTDSPPSAPILDTKPGHINHPRPPGEPSIPQEVMIGTGTGSRQTEVVPRPIDPTETPTPTASSHAEAVIVATPEPADDLPYQIEDIVDSIRYGYSGDLTSTMGGETYSLLSRDPSTFPSFFDGHASHRPYREFYFQEYDLVPRDEKDGAALYDQFILDSLEYSRQRLNYQNMGTPFDAKTMTHDMLIEFEGNLVGQSPEFDAAVSAYWETSVYPHLPVTETYSPYFVDYLDFFRQNVQGYMMGGLEIVDQNGQTMTVDIGTLADSTVSNEMKLQVVKEFRSRLPEDVRKDLDLLEGSKLMGVWWTIDPAAVYYGLLQNELADTQATPIPISTPESSVSPPTPIPEQPMPSPVTTESSPAPQTSPTPEVMQISLSGPEVSDPVNKNGATWEVWHETGRPPYYETMMEQLTAETGWYYPIHPINGNYTDGNPLGAVHKSYKAGNEVGYHTGADFIAEEGTPVRAPMNIYIVQWDGPSGNSGTNSDGKEIGQGEHVVIGYLGEFTYTDENGITKTGDVFMNFGHMNRSPAFEQLLQNELGRLPNKHEVVGVHIPRGTEIGLVGKGGLSMDSNGNLLKDPDFAHLHMELMVSWRDQAPNPHLSLEQHGLPPGLRYTAGPDGKWYVQTGDVNIDIARMRGLPPGNVPSDQLYQWPFGVGSSIQFIEFYNFDNSQSSRPEDTLVRTSEQMQEARDWRPKTDVIQYGSSRRSHVPPSGRPPKIV